MYGSLEVQRFESTEVSIVPDAGRLDQERKYLVPDSPCRKIVLQGTLKLVMHVRGATKHTVVSLVLASINSSMTA